MPKYSNWFWSNRAPSSYINTQNIWRRVRVTISLWPKEYEAGEFWKEGRKETTDPEPPCTKIGLSLLGRAAEPTHFEPSWDPISQFGKGSIQDRFTRKAKQAISLLPLSSLASGACSSCAVCFPSHVSLRVHLSHCNYRGNWLQGKIYRSTVVCAEPSVCWIFSRQVSWALAHHQMFHFCQSRSTRQISGTWQQQSSMWCCSRTVSVRDASEHQTEKRVMHLPDALEVEWSLENCSLWFRNLYLCSKGCIPLKLVET